MKFYDDCEDSEKNRLIKLIDAALREIFLAWEVKENFNQEFEMFHFQFYGQYEDCTR